MEVLVIFNSRLTCECRIHSLLSSVSHMLTIISKVFKVFAFLHWSQLFPMVHTSCSRALHNCPNFCCWKSVSLGTNLFQCLHCPVPLHKLYPWGTSMCKSISLCYSTPQHIQSLPCHLSPSLQSSATLLVQFRSGLPLTSSINHAFILS